ncbi:MAG: glycosyltransferase, partial [Candidatus Theseobacter exili]|nr:glycosyltransferase [Candidatus Theseobacter exili]
RNVAISKTSSELISFIDQDDIWHADKLKNQVAILKHHPDFSCVHTDIQFIDESEKVLTGKANRENSRRAKIFMNSPSINEVSKSLFASNRIRLISSIITRKAFEEIKGFDTSLFGGEDWDFWVRLSKKFKIFHLKEILVSKRVHLNNVSVEFYIERTYGHIQAFHKVIKEYPDLSEIAHLRAKFLFTQICSYILKKHTKPNNYIILFRQLFSLLFVPPLPLKSFVKLGLSCFRSSNPSASF